MVERSFSDWSDFYASHDFPSLLAEGATLQDVTELNRICAYLVRLIDLACDDPDLSNANRTQAIRLAGSVEDTVRQGLSVTNQTALNSFELALAATINRVTHFGLYPAAAEMIASGQFVTTRKV